MEIKHEPWCNSVLDDESDYEYLYDAGECTCGAINKAKEEEKNDIEQ